MLLDIFVWMGSRLCTTFKSDLSSNYRFGMVKIVNLEPNFNGTQNYLMILNNLSFAWVKNVSFEAKFWYNSKCLHVDCAYFQSSQVQSGQKCKFSMVKNLMFYSNLKHHAKFLDFAKYILLEWSKMSILAKFSKRLQMSGFCLFHPLQAHGSKLPLWAKLSRGLKLFAKFHLSQNKKKKKKVNFNQNFQHNSKCFEFADFILRRFGVVDLEQKSGWDKLGLSHRIES